MHDDGSPGIFTYTGMWPRVTYLHSARQLRNAEVVECAASSIYALDVLDKIGLKVSQDMILCIDSYG